VHLGEGSNGRRFCARIEEEFGKITEREGLSASDKERFQQTVIREIPKLLTGFVEPTDDLSFLVSGRFGCDG
jgi:hypothetical protein